MYNQEENTTNVNNNKALLTVNELSVQLKRNYRTTAKTIAKMVNDGLLEEVDGVRNHRAVKVYNITPDTLKTIRFELDKRTNKITKVQEVNTSNASGVSELVVQLTSANNYANSLKSKLQEQQEQLYKKDVQIAKIEAENYKLQSDVKLIEDKQKTFEASWAEEKQRANELQKEVNRKNRIINIFCGFFLIILCYFVFSFLFTH